MQINNFTFLSSNNIDTIHGKEWIPDGHPRFTLQIAHGMQEFMGNYEQFAEDMCSRGVYVIAFDCIGHGDSVSSYDNLGFFPDKDSSEFLILDIRHVTEIAKKRFYDIPHIMFGHSFGSFLTRIYISRYRDIDGAVIMGSGIVNLNQVKRLLYLIDISRRKHGSHYRSRFIMITAFGRKVRKFLPMKNNFEWISRDEKIVNDFLKEKRNNYIFTLNGFETLFITTIKANEPVVLENTPKNLPVFIVSGEFDAVGNYGKGIMQLYNSMGDFENAKIKLYKDARHNLLHEICYKEVYNDIFQWCDTVKTRNRQ